MFTQSTPNALATLRNSVHSKSNSQTVTSTAVSSRLMIAALALATILSLKSEAQYPAPPPPTTYPYAEGTLIVSEGLVAVDSMDPTEDSQGYSRGQSAAVAITESLSGSARFIVTWESDGRWLLNVSGGTLNYRAVLANRFSAGGECVTWGACAPSGCGPKDSPPTSTKADETAITTFLPWPSPAAVA